MANMKNIFVPLLLLSTASALPQIFPFPCTTTTTYVDHAVATFVQDVISFTTVTRTITLPASTTTSVTYTTSFTPASTSCYSSGTILTPTTLPAKRSAQAPVPTAAASLPDLGFVGDPVISSVFFNPFNSLTCTAVVESFSFTTTTETHVATRYALTTTVPTVTATVTGTVVQPTPASYDGLNYYQYTNTYNYNTNTGGYGSGGYRTSDWRGNYGYDTNGKQNPINFASPNWPNDPPTCQLQGQTQATDCQQWTVVFQGYLFARDSGNYTLTGVHNLNDNELLVWGGDKAYRSYTDSNSDLVALYRGTAPTSNPDNKPEAFTYSLVAGQLFPVTLIIANGRGPMKLDVQVTGPNGVDYTNSGNFLVAPCDVSAFIP